MKILLAVHHFPPRYNAGAELYTYRLARWLIANGHQAEVLCVEELDLDRPAGLEVRRDLYDGIPVQRLSLGMASTPGSWSYDHPLINAWLRTYLAQNHPDLVHLHSGYLLGAGVINEAHRAGVPTVVTLHDYWFLCPRITLLRGDGSLCAEIPEDPAGCAWCLHLDQRRYRLPEQLSGRLASRTWIALASGADREAQAARRAYLRHAIELTDRLIAPSRFLATMFAHSVAPEKLYMLRYGLDRDRLAEVPLPSPSNTLRLGYLGQIVPHKGVHILVHALLQLPFSGRPVELRIFGNPEQNPTYTRQLRKLIGTDPRIRLAGRFSSDQLPAVLGDLDLTVVPSIWYENSPLAIMEAHAAGRPVLTSRLGGMAELVSHDVNGLHFQPGNASDLARQIQRLRDEPTLLDRLRSGIGPIASVDDEMVELMAIYAGLIGQRRPVGVAEVA